jgi:hypothetical protein
MAPGCAHAVVDIRNPQLAADANTLDQSLIALFVFALHIVEQTSTQTHHLEESATRMMILGVGLKMLGQVFDPLRKDRDLDLGGTCVTRLGFVFFD